MLRVTKRQISENANPCCQSAQDVQPVNCGKFGVEKEELKRESQIFGVLPKSEGVQGGGIRFKRIVFEDKPG